MTKYGWLTLSTVFLGVTLIILGYDLIGLGFGIAALLLASGGAFWDL